MQCREVINPISNGVISDWEIMKEFWHYIFFKKLRINPKDYFITIVEPFNHDSRDRQRLVQV